MSFKASFYDMSRSTQLIKIATDLTKK